MTKFFVPIAKDEADAEYIVDAVAKHISAPVPPPHRRIRKVTWVHNGKRQAAEVGKPVDKYFGGEEVIVILESGSCYCVCTANRGVFRGGPILTNRFSEATAIVYFDGERSDAA